MLSILLIGISLSMDALAIAVTNGMTLRDFNFRHALWMGLYFGGFQFLMPLIGCLLGGTVSRYVSTFGPYISFFLLAFIGGKMLFDSIRGGGDDESGMQKLSHRRLLAMAVASSIDALGRTPLSQYQARSWNRRVFPTGCGSKRATKRSPYSTGST